MISVYLLLDCIFCNNLTLLRLHDANYSLLAVTLIASVFK